MEKRHEILFNQLQSYREATLHSIENVNDEMVDIVPPGFSNNIRWNLGHIYLDQYLWLQHLTKEPIAVAEQYRQWFDFGTKPSDWTTAPPSLDTLKQLLAGQPRVIREQYGDRLEEEFPATEAGMYTIAQVLVRTIYHEGLHVAAIHAIRRFI